MNDFRWLTINAFLERRKPALDEGEVGLAIRNLAALR